MQSQADERPAERFGVWFGGPCFRETQDPLNDTLQAFARTRDRFWGPPLRKLFYFGPWRFLNRRLMRLFARFHRREANLFFWSE